MLDFDPTVQVAIIGVFSTLVTTSGVMLVAILNSRKEKVGGSPDVTEILAQRIKLRDERIEALREDKIELRRELDECMRQNDEKDALIERLTNNQINEENHASHPDRRL